MLKRGAAFLTGLLVLALMFGTVASAMPQFPMDYVYADGKNKSAEENARIYIPITYNAAAAVFQVEDESAPMMFDPEDLFIAGDDSIYVADTGNNRIVSFTPDGKTKAVFYEASGSPFSSPRGVYVAANGDIYVADSGNNRVVQMSGDGKLIKEFTKPDSDLLQDMASFDPSKVIVGPNGYIYILVGNKFMSIDNNNAFKGYLGATEVGFSLTRLLIRTFASKEQRRKLGKAVVPSYNNLFIDSSNRFIACSSADTDQIRVINSVGKNIFNQGFYGEVSGLDIHNNPIYPKFADLTVDKNGIISLIEQTSGKIYQYDNEGNILTIFAGLGDNKGYFTSPVSIASDSRGRLYVLDKTAASIQRFDPTAFITQVHEAISVYNEGRYDAALTAWSDIVKMNSDYPLARRQLGAIYLKREDAPAALEHYKIADDMAGYSRAFSLYRHNVFREHFTLIVILAALLLAAAIVGIIFLKRYADRLQKKAYALRGVQRR